jgi:hypothetical protein
LYRALTQEAPWRAPSLQHWPAALHIDPTLRARLDQARFGPQPDSIVFADLKQHWWRACGQIGLAYLG